MSWSTKPGCMVVPLLAAFISLAFVSGSKAQDPPILGYWSGSIQSEGKVWRVDLRVERNGADYRAFADFPDADGYDREFELLQPGSVHVVLTRPQPSGIPIVFDGVVAGNTFRGDWSGFGKKAAFMLERVHPRARDFRETEVFFQNGQVKLSGTLILPEVVGPIPAVVITHGATPNDRSGYRGWALQFVRRGFAALIFDKRGAGASTGDTRSASMQDLASDAVAGVRFLKARRDIEKSSIGVIGHSQGGWIAPLASTMSKDIAFVIASAASGVGPAEQSIYHRANIMRAAGFSEKEVAIASDLRSRLYATGRMILDGSPKAQAVRDKLSSELGRYANEPWLDAAALPPNLDNDEPTIGGLRLLFFDPVPMWAKVKVPVLLVWGDKDVVVPVVLSNKKITTALKKAGNKNVTVKTFANVDHATTLVPQKNEWDFPRTNLEYYRFIADWAARLVSARVSGK